MKIRRLLLKLAIKYIGYICAQYSSCSSECPMCDSRFDACCFMVDAPCGLDLPERRK